MNQARVHTDDSETSSQVSVWLSIGGGWSGWVVVPVSTGQLYSRPF